MKGIHHITVSNAVVKYDFSIRRNITIIKGDSATGKTTLVELISEYYESGAESGIELNSDKTCRALSGRDWKIILSTINDSIVFIDEDNDFIPTDEFASQVKNSDNYYVIVTREGLPNLPYSVDEIYGIRVSGKYAGLKQTYNELFHIYGEHRHGITVKPEVLIVEDSNSGYEFFKGINRDKKYDVESAGGKSNIFSKVYNIFDKTVVIIADGAAFGSEMDRLMKLTGKHENITIFLPESFEWLILSANLTNSSEIQEILERPSYHIESSEFFSWERFFTHLLTEETHGTYLQYTKRHLNEVYLQEKISKKIISRIEDIELM